jgi:RsiW-degrading membrane proteinase PrsW (M82 family)
MNQINRKKQIEGQMTHLGYDFDLLKEVLGLEETVLTKYLTGRTYPKELSYQTFLMYLELDVQDYGFRVASSEKPFETSKLFRIKKQRIKPLVKSGYQLFLSLFKKSEISTKDVFLSYQIEKDVIIEPVLFKRVLYGLLTLSILNVILSNLLVLTPILISSIVPLVFLVYLFELEKKDLGLIHLLLITLLGGILSIGLTHLIRELTGYPAGLTGDVVTGLVEEAAKLIVVFVLLRYFKIKHVYQALLIGFAVGAGFDILETAEYGLNALFSDNGSYRQMLETLLLRSVFALGIGHHFWTMTLAVILHNAKKFEVIEFKALIQAPVIFAYVIVSLFHALWNSGILGLFYLLQLVVGFVLFVLVVDNVRTHIKPKEIKEEVSHYVS